VYYNIMGRFDFEEYRRLMNRVPRRHQRFCASCAEKVHTRGRGYSMCPSTIDVLLRLYWTSVCC